MTFGNGEQVLSAWMADNALVTWLVTPEPWQVEEDLIKRVSLPLNLDQNTQHAFHHLLSNVRKSAKARARALPVVSENETPS